MSVLARINQRVASQEGGDEQAKRRWAVEDYTVFLHYLQDRMAVDLRGVFEAASIDNTLAFIESGGIDVLRQGQFHPFGQRFVEFDRHPVVMDAFQSYLDR